VGVNLYDAAASDVYSCNPADRLSDDELAATLADLHADGATVVRFWAYQSYTDGGRDFSGVDRVLRAAEDADLRVMPVLEDGPGDCSTGEPDVPLDQVESDSWYTEGYREPLGTARLSFRDYAALVAERYADEPVVLAWTLVNEAETPRRTQEDRSVLVGFAQDVGAVVQDAAPHQLVTLGTQGNGAPGGSGTDLREIYSLPEMDFVEVHDWAFYGDDESPMPGGEGGRPPSVDDARCRRTDAPVGCAFAIAADIGKPLVVGEVGIAAEDEAGRERRARLLLAKGRAALDAGASGYLLWHWNDGRTDGYDIAPGDPALGVLATLGGVVSGGSGA